MNTLQRTYNKLILLANLHYIESKEKIYAPLHRELTAKVEAFEAAADCLLDAFPDDIRQADTMRFLDIRQSHLSDENKKTKTENADTILSSYD